MLRLHPALAPVKVAVLPLLRKDGHPEKARAVYEELRRHVKAEYDDGGAIGRRYRRQDEIGTPFAVTIDHQTLEDDTVTLRDRDTLEQERVPVDGLARLLQDRTSAVGSSLVDMASTAADQVSYEDLYARWERGNWRATEIDFTEDRRQWHEAFTDLERRAALWNYALFFWGEDAVADNLSPFIDAAPREEQKYFLATQQVDEARHAVFFKRFMHEVAGIGDGTRGRRAGGDPARSSPGASSRRSSCSTARRRAAPRPLAHQARAGGDALPRRRRGDARAARPALHRGLPDASATCCPASAAGCATSRSTSSATSASASSCCATSRREDPDVPAAVADLLREVLPYTLAVFVPPGWDRRYTECFGFTLEEIYEEGGALVREQAARRRAAARDAARADPVPARPAAARARAARDRDARRPGCSARRTARPPRDPETMALLFDIAAPRRRPPHTRRAGR